MSLNYYQILKVDTNAVQNQIESSYQKLHQLWSSRKMNEKALDLLKEVFETLSNPNKRKKEYLACQIKHLYKLTNPIKKEVTKSQYGLSYRGLSLYNYCSKSPELKQVVNFKKVVQIF